MSPRRVAGTIAIDTTELAGLIRRELDGHAGVGIAVLIQNGIWVQVESAKVEYLNGAPVLVVKTRIPVKVS